MEEMNEFENKITMPEFSWQNKILKKRKTGHK